MGDGYDSQKHIGALVSAEEITEALFNAKRGDERWSRRFPEEGVLEACLNTGAVDRGKSKLLPS